MKGKLNRKRRWLVVLLTGLLVITMMPVSAFYGIGGVAKAEDREADVAVAWTPKESSLATGAHGTIHLSANLKQRETESAEKAIASADVSIRLTEEEAEALTDFKDETRNKTTEGIDDIQLTKDGSGFSLNFTLNKDKSNLEADLNVNVPSKTTAPFTFSVDEEDISVEAKGDDGSPIADAIVSKAGGDMALQAECKWEVALGGEQSLAIGDSGVPNFNYTFSAKSQATGETGVLYTASQALQFALTLPVGIAAPQAELTAKDNRIFIGEYPLAEITGLPEGAKIEGLSRSDDGRTLSFTAARQRAGGDDNAQELSDIEGSIIFYGSALTVGEDLSIAEDTEITLKLNVSSLPLDSQTPVEVSAERKIAVTEVEADPTEGIAIDEYRQAYEQTIFWVDNNNEGNKRPTAEGYPRKLYFSLDDGSYVELTEENMASTGLKAMPNIEVKKNSSGSSYTFSVGSNSLPTRITVTDEYGDKKEHTISWRFTPQQVDGYQLQEITEENLEDYSSVSEPGWYYVLLTDFVFDIQLRWGDLGSAPGITQAIYDNFDLHVSIRGEEQSYHLNTIKDDIDVVTDPSDDPDNPTRGTATIHNVWKYNLDGSLISYTVEEVENGNGTIKSENLDEGDYFKISYDNTSAPNFGSVTDKLHNGGTLYLTLTGKKTYDSKKVWLDAGTPEAIEKRPTGEFQLWRYRAGQDYSTASPVYDEDGEFISVNLDTTKDQELLFKDLEKYDAEGYEYIYVIKEYLDSTTEDGEPAASYEQVFGEVSENGTITDRIDAGNGDLVFTTDPDDREETDICLYNGGTLSNRIKETVSTEVTKVWKAAALQADFEDISVELTLQARAKGTDEPWQNTDETVTMDEFYSEQLTDSAKAQANKYDHLGRELEYRWVESAVYQGEIGENLLQPDSTFVLTQNGREIRYESASVVQEDGSTLIENSIANTIKYDIEKKWVDEKGEDVSDEKIGQNVTFYLYRTINGKDMEKVAEFVMNGIVDKEKTLVNETLGIYMQETDSWKATVEPLDEYDEDGRLYEYALIEDGGHPDMETKKDEDGNYYTKVTNGPGKGNWIIVRKEWVDDSDITHREPVTITVYNRKTNAKVGSIVLGEDEIWYDWFSIGDLEPEDVYILETKVGEQEITGNPETAPNEYDGDEDTDYTEVQFETQHHKYAATYSHGKIEEANTTFYEVSNRRLGNVNLTVTKKWTDGDEARRVALKEAAETAGLSLVLRLRFADGQEQNYYDITYDGWKSLEKGDTVTIGNLDHAVPIQNTDREPADAIQPVNFEAAESDYTFFNLPKYNRNGTVVRYTVEEVWVDEAGEIIDRSALAEEYKDVYELYSEYAVSYTEDYDVGTHHDADKQTIDVENRLSSTKSVLWHKQWNDDYVYNQGQRPDIYLNIYQTKHTSADPDSAQTTLYRANYKWTFGSNAGDDPDGLYSKQYHWHAELENLPKYDEYGYEIMYYATEHMDVDSSAFDYQNVGYAVEKEGGRPGDTEAIGTEFSVDEKHLDHVQEVSGLDKTDSEHYALEEGGTFINSISSHLTVKGQKLWTSLPDGYPVVDLPEVTFELYQELADGTGEAESKKVAELTVSDWASVSVNGSYVFQIEYMGTNRMTVIDGEAQVTPEDENAQKLPKYDEQGRLYTYTLKEKADTGITDSDLVYRDSITNTYLVNNIYDSVKGALAVKKFLELPFGEDGEPLAFPAVTFELTRTYRTNADELSDPEVVDRVTWTSEEVRSQYKQAKVKEPSKSISALEKILSFEDLDIYAPNGSKYTYSVREVKDELGGYDTWVVKKNVEICNGSGEEYKTDENRGIIAEDLGITMNEDGGRGETADDLTPAATFINAPETEEEKVVLQGDKVWEDYDNLFETRPEDITIEVSRYANSQTGQNNPVPEEKVAEGSYDVIWEKEQESGKWSYTIEGKANGGELERYAPNGMPWEYVVTETLPERSVYEVSPSTGRVGEEKEESSEAGTTITMKPLTNTIESSVPYSKNWVDSEGNIITGDYLNLGSLHVSFKLQVTDEREDSSDWTDAESYFRNNLSDEAYNKLFADYDFTAELSGILGDTSVWGKTNYFNDLPRVIKNKEGAQVELAYRVIETKIKYGSASVNVTVKQGNDGTYTYTFDPGTLFSPAYWADGKDAKETEANKNTTRDLYNRLKTTSLRVAKIWEGDNHNAYGTRPKTEREGYTWQTSFVVQRATGGASWENVTVYDTSGSRDLVVTLYGKDTDDRIETTVAGLPETDETGEKYTYRIRELQPDYQLNAGKVREQDIVENEGIYNDTYEAEYNEKSTEVTNRLKTTRITAEKIWKPDGYEVPEGTEITFHLQYKDGTSWKTLASVKLDGTADADPQKPYYENAAWKAVWKDLPVRIPGQTEKAEYRVIEDPVSGYIQEVKKNEGGSFTVTNTASTTYAVKKVWGGVSPSEQKDVVVGLYRTTDESIPPEPVLNADGEPVTLTLNSESNWAGNFTDLEKYDSKGNVYIYSVKELTVGGVPAEETGFIIHIGEDENQTAVITNIETVEVGGIKTWKDNGDAYHTRPDDLVLTLYRSVKGGEPEVVDASAVWEKNGDVWNYKYTGLPKTDDQGNLYTYTVEETVPDGYVGTQTGNNFVNTLKDTVDIPVTKIWEDNQNASGSRPDKITVVLYANGSEVKRVTLSAAGGIVESALRMLGAASADTWEYVFTDLPKYDEDGVLIEYTVKELTVPDGYEDHYDGYTIKNVMAGDLTVSKTVGGDAGDKTKAFSFTVTLSDKTINGKYGDMEFAGGVAQFKLKHGEYAKATGLPGGITYTVTEAEANADGYITSSAGASGTVPAGGTASAAFTNTKYAPSARYGNLTVSKTVGGDAGDRGKAFHFTVTLSDKTINGKYGDMEFAGGVAEFTLKHGESASAYRLPAGITYTVSEKEADADGYTTSSVGSSGTIPVSGTSQASFVNYKDKLPERTGGLTVSKTVRGDAGDKTKAFHFTVTLSDKTINGKYGDMEFAGGVAEFTLKHGESVIAGGLPAGIIYTVTEAEAGQDGYKTDADGENGIIEGDKTAEASFVNAKSSEPDEPDTPDKPDRPDDPNFPGDPGNPKTGDTASMAPYVALLLTAAALIVVLTILSAGRKKKKARTDDRR